MKMKASDLRLNNLVYYYSEQGKIPRKINVGDLIRMNNCLENTDYEPIELSEDILLKADLEYWGERRVTKYEEDKVYCLHNIICGTSDFKVCLRKSNYGEGDYFEWIIMVDDDHIYLYYNLEYVHQLQNLYFALTGSELEITL